MIVFLLRRLVYTLPIMLGVALVCFALVHLAPGDPLVSVLPPDASSEMQQQLRTMQYMLQFLAKAMFYLSILLGA